MAVNCRRASAPGGLSDSRSPRESVLQPPPGMRYQQLCAKTLQSNGSALRLHAAADLGVDEVSPLAVSRCRFAAILRKALSKQSGSRHCRSRFLEGAANSRKVLKTLVGERGFEPPTPWSRISFRQLWKSVEACCCNCFYIERFACRSLNASEIC